MTPKPLTPDQTEALHAAGDQPLPVVDLTTNLVYLLVDRETHLEAMEALAQHKDAESIQRGIADMEAGRYQSADDAFAKLRENRIAKYGR